MSEYPKLRFVKYIYLDPSDNKLKGVNPPGITPLVKNSYITFVGEYGEVIRFVTDLSSCWFKMNVVCIFPITGNHENIAKIMLEFKETIGPQLKILGATQLEIKFAGNEYVYVGTNQTLEGPPKGKGILQCIRNCPTPPNVIISCDGSNKIPYSYIINIFQEIVSDYNLCCVMANRKGNKAISEFRYLIENFEIFILRKYYNHNRIIPDGQCGLWAYKYGKLNLNGDKKEINLIAEGYEIELDLLGEVLKNNLTYSFVDVTLPHAPLENVKSLFNYENNLKKMKFLFTRHERLKDLIDKYFLEFEKINPIKPEIKEQWENYKLDVKKITFS